MTDAEHEAQIREVHLAAGHCDPEQDCNEKFLLRLLDEARASIRLRSADYSDGDRTVIVGQYTIDRLRNGEAVEIGPLPIILLGADDLRISPEAGVMGRAKNLLLDWMQTRPADTYQSSIKATEFTRLIEIVARALIEYGDQRAREGIEELRKACADILGYDTDWPQHGNVLLAIAAALQLRVTEARAAALEEAAQVAYDQASDDPPPGDWCDACGHIHDAIRALADTPPQSESGEG